MSFRASKDLKNENLKATLSQWGEPENSNGLRRPSDKPANKCCHRGKKNKKVLEHQNIMNCQLSNTASWLCCTDVGVLFSFCLHASYHLLWMKKKTWHSKGKHAFKNKRKQWPVSLTINLNALQSCYLMLWSLLREGMDKNSLICSQGLTDNEHFNLPFCLIKDIRLFWLNVYICCILMRQRDESYLMHNRFYFGSLKSLTLLKLKTFETSARNTFRLMSSAILMFIAVSNLIVGQFGKYF